MNDDILEFIEFINDLATDLFIDKEMVTGEVLFRSGACYDFVRIVKEYFEIDNIFINNKMTHCILLYKGKYYDSSGEVLDVSSYKACTSDDILFMEEFFGGHISYLSVFEKIINELSLIKNLPFTPLRGKVKKKINNI